MRTTVVQALGLVTQPNKYGQYAPGALSRALNVCMRDPGIVSSLPDVRTYRADVSLVGHATHRIAPGGSSLLALNDGGGAVTARWVTSGASTAITTPGGASVTCSAGKTHVAVMRARWLVSNDTLEPMLFDSEGDTTARRAGLPPPTIVPSSLSATNPQAVATATTVAYRVLIRRLHSDGYETISAPSEPMYVTNSIGSTHNPLIRVALPVIGGATTAVAGDVVEIYRSKAVAAGSSPGDTLYLAVSYVLTSSDITATTVTITDSATEASLAEELYTNPGQQSIDAAKMPPPLSADVTSFKGSMFYAASRLRCAKRLKIPGPTGNLSSATERATGIGRRSVTGDVSNGSSDIANVSDMTGLAIGQRLTVASNDLNGGTITAIVGTTVTMSSTSNQTVVGKALDFDDVIRIDSSSVTLSSLFDANFGAASAGARFVYEDSAPTYVFTGPNTETVTWPPTFTIEKLYVSSTDMTLRATNGANYFPELPDISESAVDVSADPRTNRYMWSLEQQPEATPPLSYAYVGNGTLYRMTPTRDALYMWCSDGLFRLSGDGGEWRTDPFDPNLVLAARNAVDVLDGKIWAYTNEGLVSVSDHEGVQYISRGVIGDLIPGAVYADTWDTFLTCDELHHEVWLTFRSGGNSVSYVYNTLTKAFTTVDDDEWSCMAYSRALRSLVIGAVSSNPDVLYFEDDTSATRMPGADIRFQPIVPTDPASTVQFVDMHTIFAGAGSAMTLVPTFDGTAYTSVTVPASSIESRAIIPVPRNAPAIAERIAPGFTLSSGGTSQAWSLRGLSVRSVYGSEEARR